MSLATEFLQTCKEGFANKDSSSVGGFITDDFEMITPVTSRPRQGFWDLVAKGGNPAIIEDVEVIYENDDVAVVSHGTNSGETYTGKVLCCGRKRDGKFYDWRLARLG
jgi:hypothetical protein